MKSARFLGWDIIRLVSFIPIVMYHLLEAVWGDHRDLFQPVMSTDPLFWNFIYEFMRVLSFSGFSIFLLTFFLMGFSAERRKVNGPLIALLALGWIIFCWAYEGFSHLFIFWDVYPLIAVSLLFIQLVLRFTKIKEIYFGLFGFILTLVPFWEFSFFSTLSLRTQMVLVGNCEAGLSGWPVLPWMGLAIFAYSGGRWIKPYIKNTGDEAGLPFTKPERFIWPIVLLISVFFWGAYYQVNLDMLNVFDCLTYRQSPLEFWAHLIWIVFFIRLSLVPAVQRYLQANFKSVSQFATSKNFAFVYFYSFVVTSAIALPMSSRLQREPNLFTLYMVVNWIFIEITARFLLRFFDGRKAHVQ